MNSIMEVVQQIGARFKVEPSEIKKVSSSFPSSSFLLLLPPSPTCYFAPLPQRREVNRLTLPRFPRSTQSISSLIDREYMRRKDGELNVFEYMA